MRHCCMDGTDPAAVFFDFAAAFPSLSHEYLHAVLEHLGIPASFRHLVKALYEGNGCTIATAGGSFAGFSIRAGIRQGCPLSPLLFAVCGDLLVRRLRSACPESLVRAYADDLAVVTRKWRAMLTAARPVFDDFAAASGLFLNLGKTVFIPLGDDNVDTFRRDLGVVCPGWGGALVQMQAEYLGFTLGPEAGDKGWTNAFAKARLRARLWSSLGLGLHLTAVAYETYISSVLGFLLQLEVLPSSWPELEAAIFRNLVPSPGYWIMPKDLHILKDHLGMPKSFADMKEISLAARFRVAHREASANRGLRAERHAQALDRAFANSEHVIRTSRRRAWLLDSAYHRLQAAVSAYRVLGFTVQDVEKDLGANGPRPYTRQQIRRLSRGLQAGCRKRIAAAKRAPPEGRMREKLSIWRVQLFPRLRVTRALEVLKRLRRLVPPRVVAATLRTWFNGWCTARRFQGRDSCFFGCRLGEDSVHHYLRCVRLQDFGTARLRLPSEERPEARTLAALMLQPGSSMNDEVFTRRALLVAAAYRLHCTHRHGRPVRRCGGPSPSLGAGGEAGGPGAY